MYEFTLIQVLRKKITSEGHSVDIIKLKKLIGGGVKASTKFSSLLVNSCNL
jgi:hypothetical protein